MTDSRTAANVQNSRAAFRQAGADQLRERPWLAAYLLRHNAALYARFVHFYHRLRSLPRRVRRGMRRRLATTLAGAALMLALSGAPATVGAQEGGGQVTAVNGTINVDGTTCTLVDAITSANSSDTGGCSGASAGADEIVLLASSTHTFTVANNAGSSGSNALPQITSDITIQGNGSTIERTGAVNMRLFEVNGGSLTLNEVTVSGGDLSAAATTGGGGIFVYSGTLAVNHSTISGNNVASTDFTAFGGGIGSMGGDISIYASTISGNDASGDAGGGGGVGTFEAGGSLTVENSTFSGNTSSSSDSDFGGGAAIYFYDTVGTLSIESSTITNNTHTGGNEQNPGGVYSYDSGATFIYGSIITGNTGVGADDCDTDNLGSTTSSLIGSDECGGDAPDMLYLGPLSDNGGPTMTHALLSGSDDAIDAIPIVSAAANSVETVSLISCTPYASVDQRGNARASGTGYGGDACDIGAFEFASAGPVAVTLQGLSATAAEAPQTAAATGLLAMVSLAVSSLWLRRRRSRA